MSWNKATGLDSVSPSITRAGRNFPATVGYGAGAAIFLGFFEFTGATLQGLGLGPAREDDYGSKEWMRKNRRRPIQETLDELGEGRGEYSAREDDMEVSLTYVEACTDLGIGRGGLIELRKPTV